MQPTQYHSTPDESILAVSLENSKKNWKIGLYDGKHNNPTVKTVDGEHPAQRLSETVAVIETMKKKWGLPEDTQVVVVYEAGQDGFWIQRALEKLGYEVLVVDPASMPVERHAKRAKTDRLDAIMLVMNLWAWLRGERDRMRVVRVLSEQDEAQRQLVRERGELQKETQQSQDRTRKLLRTVGCWTRVDATFAKRLAAGEVRCHDGRELPQQLRDRLKNECERLALAQEQLKDLEASMQERVTPEARADIEKLTRLMGIGVVGATRMRTEFFWRDFNNRRQVGACLGMVPQPYDSGQSRVDQGISKRSGRRVRPLAIEWAWMWPRYQPDSELTKWFLERTRGGGKRMRRIYIVGLARKLVIALWRYLKDDTVPKGAVMKPMVTKPA